MSLTEIVLTAIALSMDAFAVSMTNGMVYPKLPRRKWIIAPLFFGFFQGFMPLLGFLAGSVFSSFIERYSSILVFVILGFIGGKMIYDGFFEKEEENKNEKLTVKLITLQAIATSIDAFAVGIGFCAVRTNIILAVSLIAITTLVLTLISFIIGKKFGDILGSKAQIFGGTILVILAIKALF